MKRSILLTICFFAGLQLATAEPLTYYSYLSDHEITIDENIIWFWTPDTVWGPLRSNDYIGLKSSPTFYDRVITAKECFRYYQPRNIYFQYAPVFNAAPYHFPCDLTYLRRLAQYHITDQHGTKLTTLMFRGDAIDIYQRDPGGFGEDSLIERYALNEGEPKKIIDIDGDVDMAGRVDGLVTVYATGEIGLIDNLIYAGSNDTTGFFDPRQMRSMLALVSERNIVIRNTEANGRNNGYEEAGGDWDRHSIAINGSLIAMGESFTFEDQNEDWDIFQGPTTDLRGRIYMTGGIIQTRRGYVHRSNHVGTGYDKSYHYDDRLRTEAPPGFGPEELPELSGSFLDLNLPAGHTYNLTGVTADVVKIASGTTLNLSSGRALTVLDSLIISGDEEAPVEINCANGSATITISRATVVSLNWAEIGEDIELVYSGESFEARNSSFGGEVSVEGDAAITRCRFEDNVNLAGFGDYRVEGSVFRDGLYLSGGRSEGSIENCTFVGSRNGGVRLRGQSQPAFVNCIFAFNRYGILNDTRYEPTLRYSDVFGNRDDDLIDVRPGEGCLASDPFFADRSDGDFQLGWGSPCIDAGDPASPQDPDGSRADMGAYYFDHILSVPDKEFGIGNLELGISAAPNPFNDRSTLVFDMQEAGAARVAVYDLSGRLQAVLMDGKAEAGRTTLALVGSGWPAGVYIATLRAGADVRSMKIVKVN